MSKMMRNGVAYGAPGYRVQNNSSATTLNATECPTGQTIDSWLNNKIQDNASATDLTDTKIPTGRTIESYLNSNFPKFQYGSIPITGTGSVQGDSKTFDTAFSSYAYVTLTVMRNANDDSPFNGSVRLKAISKTGFTYAFKGNNGGSYSIVFIAVGA